VSRDIKAVYAELLLPVTKNLEVNLAVRQDHYSGFGTTFNPKVSFRFQPVEQLLFRGSYNTGFRAPSFNQLFNGVTESPYAGKDLADPSKCPTRRSTAPSRLRIDHAGHPDRRQARTWARNRQAGHGRHGVGAAEQRVVDEVDFWEIRKQDTIAR
jgi:iron complex outermembrane receptor protein